MYFNEEQLYDSSLPVNRLRPDRMFLWLRTPKCASTSMYYYIDEVMRCNIIVYGETYRLPSNYNNYWIFTFVRNPFSRIVSNYKYARCRDWISRRWTLTDFICSDWSTLPIPLQQHMQPLVPYLALNKIKKNRYCYSLDNENGDADLSHIDFVGSYENVQQDFDTICDHIGVPPYCLPHINKSVLHAHNVSRFISSEPFVQNKKLADIIIDKFHLDFKYFNYSTDVNIVDRCT
jgi:hypothetical protein